METTNNKLNSAKDHEQKTDSQVKNKKIFTKTCAENASNNECAILKSVSKKDSDGSNFLNKIIGESNSRLALKSKEKCDFRNGQSKSHIIEEQFCNNDIEKQLSKENNQDNIDSNEDSLPSGIGDGEFVCQIVDEDTESGKNETSSYSVKEDSEGSIYEEDSQHTVFEESDIAVPSEEDTNSIMNEKIDTKVSSCTEENSSSARSALDDVSTNSNDSVYRVVESDGDSNFDSSLPSSVVEKDSQHSSNEDLDYFEENEPPTKRQKIIHDDESAASINSAYIENNFTEELSAAFQEKTANKFENGAQIVKEPFTCCVLPNFIQPDDFVFSLKKELMNVKMTRKLNDLYQFKSNSLDDSHEPNISIFKRLIKDECLRWMRRITNIPLTEKVDISCASYTYTDHLLCHDDELQGRRIAFIFYLVPPDWNEEDGGSLDLFTTVDGQPSEIHTSFSPRRNNFVFFEVSSVSFHQVSEVLSTKNRLSVSGWFHGPPLKTSIPKVEKLLFGPPTEVEIDVTEWINPIYFDPSTQLNIREIFEETCEISLPAFLQEEKYEEVCKALMDSGIIWTHRGPYSKRNFHEVEDIDNIPPILQECKHLFSSKAFFLILSNITALKFYPAFSEDTSKIGKVYSCIRKWSPGSYTLLHDHSFAEEYSLNVILYFNCSNWDSECGGYTSYVAIGENEELLQIDPKPNLLGVVYITEGTSNFVKYVNRKANKQPLPFFNDIYSMYIENE